MKFEEIDIKLLNVIADLNEVPQGAVNIRKDGQAIIRFSSPNIKVGPREDNKGLLVEISPGTVDEKVHLPVILTQEGLHDIVFNTFLVGENADVTIVAGCGIHNSGSCNSQHDGIHEFIVKKGARVKYVEKHYGEGAGSGKNILNPTTIIRVEAGANVEMEMVQIAGVDDTVRKTQAYVEDKGSLKLIERLLTHEDQRAESDIEIVIEGKGGAAQILSRSIARDSSVQFFKASLVGKDECNGHVECDAIIMDKAVIKAMPQLVAEHADAVLTHEAAIGKIAGEQLTKLMTLGLTEQEAVDTIIDGFLR